MPDETILTFRRRRPPRSSPAASEILTAWSQSRADWFGMTLGLLATGDLSPAAAQAIIDDGAEELRAITAWTDLVEETNLAPGA